MRIDKRELSVYGVVRTFLWFVLRIQKYYFGSHGKHFEAGEKSLDYWNWSLFKQKCTNFVQWFFEQYSFVFIGSGYAFHANSVFLRLINITYLKQKSALHLERSYVSFSHDASSSASLFAKPHETTLPSSRKPTVPKKLQATAVISVHEPSSSMRRTLFPAPMTVPSVRSPTKWVADSRRYGILLFFQLFLLLFHARRVFARAFICVLLFRPVPTWCANARIPRHVVSAFHTPSHNHFSVYGSRSACYFLFAASPEKCLSVPVGAFFPL